jgi:hypothetical protein
MVDLGIAVVLAILVLELTSGLAIAGLIALIVLLVCAISYAVGRRRASSSRPRAPRARPPRGGGPPRAQPRGGGPPRAQPRGGGPPPAQPRPRGRDG